MVKSGADFESMFVAKSQELQVLRTNEVFDGNQTFINIGELGNYPFDMDDPIFELDRPCPKASRYKGIKMKDRNIKSIDCPICTLELDVPKRVS